MKTTSVKNSLTHEQGRQLAAYLVDNKKYFSEYRFTQAQQAHFATLILWLLFFFFFQAL